MLFSRNTIFSKSFLYKAVLIICVEYLFAWGQAEYQVQVIVNESEGVIAWHCHRVRAETHNLRVWAQWQIFLPCILRREEKYLLYLKMMGREDLLGGGSSWQTHEIDKQNKPDWRQV